MLEWLLTYSRGTMEDRGIAENSQVLCAQVLLINYRFAWLTRHFLTWESEIIFPRKCFSVWGCLRQWHPIPVLLPGKSNGRRSLVGCSPWGCGESDMTEWLHFHFSLLCIGEGNGNPLQCSFLENPRDGVAQSRTRLKWLSSSSSSNP